MHALVGVKARRTEQVRALADDLGDGARAVLDLAAHLVVADLGQPRVRHRVAPDLVAGLDDPADVVRTLAHALADQEEGRSGAVLV